MQAALVDRPLTHFVGVKLTANYDSLAELVPQTRRSLLARQYEIQGILDPDTQLGVTRPQEAEASDDQVTTYIGFEVSDYKTVPSDLTMIELPAGHYASFGWKGAFDTDEFDNFYPSIFEWFKEQGQTPSMKSPWIEVYGKHNDWDDRSNPENELTVLMPIGGPAA